MKYVEIYYDKNNQTQRFVLAGAHKLYFKTMNELRYDNEELTQ